MAFDLHWLDNGVEVYLLTASVDVVLKLAWQELQFEILVKLRGTLLAEVFETEDKACWFHCGIKNE